MSNSQIAIVGGGIAGLLAAAHIARAGGQPVVIEATSRFGGRAQTRVLDDFHFNQGSHALYVGGAFCAALRELEIPFKGGAPDLPAGWALWGRQAYPLPVRLAGSHVEPLDDCAAAALRTVFERVAQGGDYGRGMPLRSVTGELPAPARSVVEALVRLSSYIHAPEELDAKAALDQLRLSFSGTIYVDEGWGSLARGLLRAATAAGAVLRSAERVTRVQVHGDGCWVELRGGETEPFGAVILTVPPSTAQALVKGSSSLEIIATNACPVRVMCLDLGLSSLPRGDANFALGMDCPTYLSVHSAVSQLAPSGKALVHLARYLAPGEKPSGQHFDELEGVADDLQPGWRGCVLHKQRLAGMTVAHDFPRWNSGGRRAAGRVEDAPGIFLAGDWVGPDGMLADASAASARAAAEAAMGSIDVRFRQVGSSSAAGLLTDVARVHGRALPE